jgi:hypothetical protein
MAKNPANGEWARVKWAVNEQSPLTGSGLWRVIG